ncbi:MAG: hypothetical protein QME51_10060 [Planctomycetota bacterium]|nr:hypothetical protein [Planctomycetota bacterium]MDI6788702.1 hypothetical protein [Planctomycetota bacterium]
MNKADSEVKDDETKKEPSTSVATDQSPLVVVTDEEFAVARQLFISFLSDPWDKLYYRDKPSHAQKVDENEFTFYTRPPATS